jgi:hypothetical protein
MQSVHILFFLYRICRIICRICKIICRICRIICKIICKICTYPFFIYRRDEQS